jgi:hypothetical protein
MTTEAYMRSKGKLHEEKPPKKDSKKAVFLDVAIT